MTQFGRAFCLFSAVLLTVPTRAKGESPPRITSISPSNGYVIVNLNLGQTSFEITGTATDPDADQKISFFIAPPPPFPLEFVPSNPGFFRIHGENLTGADVGLYGFSISPQDDARFPGPNFGPSVGLAIQIIPEPGSVTMVGLGASLLLTRRKRC